MQFCYEKKTIHPMVNKYNLCKIPGEIREELQTDQMTTLGS